MSVNAFDQVADVRGTVAGMVLAAGAGRRMGRPKALVPGPDGRPWVVHAAEVLRMAGCHPVSVVIGASADTVRDAVASLDVQIVHAPDWAEGMGASLRAGLAAHSARPTCAVLVHLVDLPDVGPDVARRLLPLGSPDVLARAAYQGRPGHPVLIGSNHWARIRADARGDRGAQGYLTEHGVVSVECSDLASGDDVDRPPVGERGATWTRRSS